MHDGMELGEPSFSATTEIAAPEECSTPAEGNNTEKCEIRR